MIAYNNNGQLVTLASGQRMWIGTSAAHEAAIQAGTMPNNCTVAIIDEAQAELKPRSTALTLLDQDTALPSAGLEYTATKDGLVVVHAYKKSGGNTLFLAINGNVVDRMPFNVPTMLNDVYGCQIRLEGFVRTGDTVKVYCDGYESYYWVQHIGIQSISWNA